MLRSHTDELADVLQGSFTRRLYADVMHGSDRVLEDLPVVGWSLSGELERAPSMTGSGTVVYQSESGESLVPNGTEGVLSPFRASLLLVMEISAGEFSERIALGTFRIDAVPSAYDVFADVNGQSRVIASRVEVDFSSLELNIIRRGFRYPEQPRGYGSCYDEIRRITGFPVVETVADRTIPGRPTWEAKQGGRWEAVETLAGILGGTAVVDSAGQIRVISDTPSDPVGDLVLGAEGTVLDVGYEVDTDGVYNAVVGTFEDAKRRPIYAIARVESGDLATTGLYGEYTRYYSSDLVKTQAQANAAVRNVLNVALGAQTYEVPVQCHINPLIELGDTLRLTGWSRPLSGRVVSFTLSDSAYMNIKLEVRRPL